MEQDEKKYVVIGEWEENDKIEWDVIADSVTREEAERIKIDAHNTWEKSVPEDKKHIPHREYYITVDKYKEKLKEEGIE